MILIVGGLAGFVLVLTGIQNEAIHLKVRAIAEECLGIVLLAGSIITCLAVNAPQKTVEFTSKGIQYIDALTNKSVTSGRIFLGTGHLNNSPVYYALVQTDKGDQLKRFDVSNCYVKEIISGQPRVVHTTVTEETRCTNKTIAFWFDPLSLLAASNDSLGSANADSSTELMDDDDTTDGYYTFYVPKGSLTYDYKVDPAQ